MTMVAITVDFILAVVIPVVLIRAVEGIVSEATITRTVSMEETRKSHLMRSVRFTNSRRLLPIVHKPDLEQQMRAKE